MVGLDLPLVSLDTFALIVIRGILNACPALRFRQRRRALHKQVRLRRL